MLKKIQSTLAFLTGLFIVVMGLVNECPRVAGIAVGLLLMGVFTVPEVIGIVKGGIGGTKEDK
jgi:hypothetical protein